ncbi:hypothetical protein R6Q59_030128 [Mikania micrantha]
MGRRLWCIRENGAEFDYEIIYACMDNIIPAGFPRKPVTTKDDLFNINAGIGKQSLSLENILLLG